MTFAASSPSLRVVPLLAIAALLAGCGDGSGSSGNGGTGGSGTGGTGGVGGAGGTTSMTIAACPTNAESHVAVVLIGPDSQPLGTKAADVTGTLTGLGIDSPPSPDCGSGQAWVEIQVDVMTTWIACLQAPNLVLDQPLGSAVTLVQTVDEHPIAPATVHTTLRVAGNLVLHVEQATYEAEVALPDGVTIAKGDKTCESPGDACQIEGSSAIVTAGNESATIVGGASGDAGGFRVYVDRYWTEKASSGCDGGDADIRLAVTPSPGI